MWLAVAARPVSGLVPVSPSDVASLVVCCKCASAKKSKQSGVRVGIGHLHPLTQQQHEKQSQRVSCSQCSHVKDPRPTRMHVSMHVPYGNRGREESNLSRILFSARVSSRTKFCSISWSFLSCILRVMLIVTVVPAGPTMRSRTCAMDSDFVSLPAIWTMWSPTINFLLFFAAPPSISSVYRAILTAPVQRQSNGQKQLEVVTLYSAQALCILAGLAV
jgi:hypothetical protein